MEYWSIGVLEHWGIGIIGVIQKRSLGCTRVAECWGSRGDNHYSITPALQVAAPGTYDDSTIH